VFGSDGEQGLPAVGIIQNSRFLEEVLYICVYLARNPPVNDPGGF